MKLLLIAVLSVFALNAFATDTFDTTTSKSKGMGKHKLFEDDMTPNKGSHSKKSC